MHRRPSTKHRASAAPPADVSLVAMPPLPDDAASAPQANIEAATPIAKMAGTARSGETTAQAKGRWARIFEASSAASYRRP
jgi:hypothetical protein